MKSETSYAVAVDIGTTKICVLIGIRIGDAVELIGVGTAPSEGMSKGVVVDISRAVDSIKQAVHQAELMAGVSIDRAHIGISGGHINSFSAQGMVPVKYGEIKKNDIAQALEAARARLIPEGQQLLHFIPQYFLLDGQNQVLDPLGMYAMRLEVFAHGITGSVASVHNLVRCCERAGVLATDLVLEQLASSESVLTPDERLLGVALIDIGGGTSDVAFYKNGSLVGTHVIPIAGTLFTSDLAIGLRTSLAEAERLKKEFGAVSLQYAHNNEKIEYKLIDGITKESVDVARISFILEARSRELFSLLHQQLPGSFNAQRIPAGIVLTGGGSLLRGLLEIAQQEFNVPVRIGTPSVPEAFKDTLANPLYATGYGLLLHALKNQDTTVLQGADAPLLFRVFSRMKSWIHDFM